MILYNKTNNDIFLVPRIWTGDLDRAGINLDCTQNYDSEIHEKYLVHDTPTLPHHYKRA